MLTFIIRRLADNSSMLDRRIEIAAAPIFASFSKDREIVVRRTNYLHEQLQMARTFIVFVVVDYKICISCDMDRRTLAAKLK